MNERTTMNQQLREVYGAVMEDIIIGYETGKAPAGLDVKSTTGGYAIGVPFGESKRYFGFRQPNVQKTDFEKDVDVLFEAACREGIPALTLANLLTARNDATYYNHKI